LTGGFLYLFSLLFFQRRVGWFCGIWLLLIVWVLYFVFGPGKPGGLILILMNGRVIALGGRFRAVYEIFHSASRAALRGQETGCRVNFDLNYAIGHLRKTVPTQLGPQRESRFHKRRPDRQRRLGSFEPELGVVVESDPDDADQVRSVAGEPAVSR